MFGTLGNFPFAIRERVGTYTTLDGLVALRADRADRADQNAASPLGSHHQAR
jgi:hypothetical protein